MLNFVFNVEFLHWQLRMDLRVDELALLPSNAGYSSESFINLNAYNQWWQNQVLSSNSESFASEIENSQASFT